VILAVDVSEVQFTIDGYTWYLGHFAKEEAYAAYGNVVKMLPDKAPCVCLFAAPRLSRVPASPMS